MNLFKLFLIVFLFSSFSYAQTRSMKWTVRGCQYTGKYDAKKVDEKKLKNAIELTTPKDNNISAFAFDLKEMEKINLNDYRKLCENEIAALEKLDLPNDPSIKAIRDEVIEHKKKTCTLDIAVNEGFKDSQKLKAIPTSSTCQKFSDALDGETSIKDVWKQMIHERCKNDRYSPEGCANTQMTVENKPRALDNIRLDVLTKGWFFCAAPSYLPKYPLSNTDEVQAKLAKLFESVTKICPDDYY